MRDKRLKPDLETSDAALQLVHECENLVAPREIHGYDQAVA